MNWSLRDTIFTGRLFRNYIISVGEENILVLCFSIGGGDARVPTPSRTWGVEGFSGLGCIFHFGKSEITLCQEDTIAL